MSIVWKKIIIQFPEIALECVHKAFYNGLICEVAGRKDGVLKIMPPLTISDEVLLEGLEIVKKVASDSLSQYSDSSSQTRILLNRKTVR